MNEMPLFKYADGRTYDPDRDFGRLSHQMRHVWRLLADGNWHTPQEVCNLIGCSDAAATARIRDLRKPRYGGHVVKSRPRAGGGTWEYKIGERT